jgi:hypothetical protein
MIQLASDPNAGKMSYLPSQEAGKVRAFEAQRGRSGHAWPFLARHADRPAHQDTDKPVSSDSGS